MAGPLKRQTDRWRDNAGSLAGGVNKASVPGNRSNRTGGRSNFLSGLFGDNATEQAQRTERNRQERAASDTRRAADRTRQTQERETNMRRGKRDDQDVVASFEEGQQPEYSDTVRLTQEALRTIGYELEADGYYGPNTAETVKQFQEEQGLEPTGVLDVYTHNRINELYREAGGDNRNFGGVNYRGE